MEKKWVIDKVNIEDQYSGIQPLVQELLYKRGLKSKNEIIKFLKGDLTDLNDPFLFRDMESAVRRIREAVSGEEKIVIYGDYDVDGITSAALLIKFFRAKYGYDLDYYLPNRITEGYGLNLEAVRKLCSKYDLMITVDCGITAVKEVNFACEAGLDVIITDHHQQGEEIPKALAVINPHMKDEKYPCKYLAGVGVAFKLCQALDGNFLDYLDLVSLGTVADIVPLKDENRIIVKEGLRELARTENPGLKTLLKKLNLYDKELTAGQVGFIIAPPLNAAGRIENPEKALTILTAKKEEEALPLVEELIQINQSRQQQEEKIRLQAEEMISEKIDFKNDRAIVLAKEGWHPGIIGIVASRLVDKYYMPVVLIALEGEEGRGSGRSIHNVNIYEALRYCSDLMLEFGGHAQAAGLTISRVEISKLRSRLNKYLKDNYLEKDFIPEIKIDSVLREKDINKDLYNIIKELEPFGMGNPRPKFLINNTNLEQCFTVGKQNSHLKLELDCGLSGIGFNMGSRRKSFKNKKTDLVFTIKLNKWQGREDVELNLIDINFRGEKESRVICYQSEKIILYDNRFSGNIEDYLLKMKNINAETAVYVNNKRFYRQLKNKNFSKNYYFFTGLDFLPDFSIDELILISLPFSLTQLLAMLKMFSNNKIKLHLLFGQKEYYTGQQLIKNHLQKLDLSDTIRYNSDVKIIKKFNDFSRIAYTRNLFEFLQVIKNNL